MGIGSVLGKPIRMDAHTVGGSNREAAKILVMMEANRDFPNEVPIFIMNDKGEETKEVIQVVYWNPPPRCERCLAFGHWLRQCKGSNGDGELKEMELNKVEVGNKA